MKKRLVAALFTVFSAIQIINVDSFAIENTGFSIKKEMLPLEEGVSYPVKYISIWKMKAR